MKGLNHFWKQQQITQFVFCQVLVFLLFTTNSNIILRTEINDFDNRIYQLDKFIILIFNQYFADPYVDLTRLLKYYSQLIGAYLGLPKQGIHSNT